MMKLYLLQAFLQESDELNTYQVFYQKPTKEEIFESLTGESYNDKSKEEREESLNQLGLSLNGIEIYLFENGCIVTDNHIYYLKSIYLHNRELIKHFMRYK